MSDGGQRRIRAVPKDGRSWGRLSLGSRPFLVYWYPMSWASRRRLIIFAIVVVVLAVPAALIFATVFHRAPTCNDRIQNQGESGVDCGGPCPYLCTADEQAPTVLFTKAFPGRVGATDVVAFVENKNPDAAARKVPYTVALYGAGNAFIQKVTGTFDLPPGATVPVFVPAISSGRQAVTAAFLSIDASQVRWYTARDTRILPKVSDTKLSGTADAPRIEATLSNDTAQPITDVTVVVVVRDTNDNVVGASKTIVPSVPAQGTKTVTFTWNAPFGGSPATIQVLPEVPF